MRSLPRDDARDVEQIVDELGLRRALRSMTSRAPAGWSPGPSRSRAHVHPADDRLERRAQLVRQHGEELVLGAVRRLRLRARRLLPRVELAVADGERGVVRHPLERDLRRVREPTGRVSERVEQPLDAAVHGDRHGERGPDALGEGERAIRPGGEGGRRLRAGAHGQAAAERLGADAVAFADRVRRRVRGHPVVHPVADLHPAALGVAHREPHEVAPAEQARGPPDRVQRGLEVERGVDRAAELGERLGLPAALVGLGGSGARALLGHPQAEQRTDVGDQLLGLDRLDQVGVGARVQRVDAVALLRERRRDLQDQDRRGERVGLELARDLDAAQVGELHVEQDQIRRVGARARERVGARRRLGHQESRLPQHARLGVEPDLVVVDVQDPEAARLGHVSVPAARRRTGRRGRRRR